VTADEPDTSTVPLSDADQERWLTYLNYDQSVKQAVRRLGALSTDNVDVFRGLLMQGRDRSRVAEYEAESIRRLQGEAFVGDEELQRALIVLHAEDPHLAEEFKRMVAAKGKPAELDQAIAALRAPAPAPVKLKLVETEAPQKAMPRTEAPRAEAAPAEPVRKETPQPPRAEPPRAAREDAPSVKAPAPLPRPVLVKQPEKEEQAAWLRPVAIAAVLVVVAAAGLVFLWPRANNEETRVAAAPVAAPAQPAASPSASQAAPPQTAAAPAVDIAMPDKKGDDKKGDDKKIVSEKPPEIRPASDGPDTASPAKAVPQPAPADTLSTPAPVPGAYYKVVRGDMLTEIAVRAYRDASKFLIIQKANPSLRHSADLILVDQVIFIPKAP
jgi:hypothetical protein